MIEMSDKFSTKKLNNDNINPEDLSKLINIDKRLSKNSTFIQHDNNKSINSRLQFIDKNNNNTNNQIEFLEKEIKILNKKKSQGDIVNISCEALYYYLKENEMISSPRLILLITLTFLMMFVLNSSFYMFILISRPLLHSYPHQCYNTQTNTIGKCTIKNPCNCQGSSCITLEYESHLKRENIILNNYKKMRSYHQNDKNTFNEKKYLKFNRGDHTNIYIYDKRGMKVNFQYKSKDKFCKLNENILYICIIYGISGFIFELIFGTLSDYIGKYQLILICSFIFLILQAFYFLTFFNLGDESILDANSHYYTWGEKGDKENVKNNSLIYWFILTFFSGMTILPLKNLIYNYFLELFPVKDKLFCINGIISSAGILSFLSNYIVLMLLEDAKWHYLIIFCLTSIFLILFMIYFRENPRFYSEMMFKGDKKLNLVRKKLACLQILDNEKSIKIFESNEKLKQILNKIKKNGNNKQEKSQRKFISKIYQSDFHSKKYLFNYILVRFCFSISLISSEIFLNNEINDYNSDSEYRSGSSLVLLLLINISSIIIFGISSFFVNPRHFILFLTLFFSLFILIAEIEKANLEIDQILNFGIMKDYFFYSSNIGMRIFINGSISTVNSLFNLSVVTYPPTLYRGYTTSIINSCVNFLPLFSMILIYLIETWGFNISIISFIGFILYLYQIHDTNMEIL
jgi:hypothetical protein